MIPYVGSERRRAAALGKPRKRVDRAWILRLHDQDGLTQREIKERTGYGETTISETVRAAGSSRPRPALDRRAAAEAVLDRGESVGSVARRLGFAPASVYRAVVMEQAARAEAAVAAIREAAKTACLDLSEAYRETAEARIREGTADKAREALDWSIGAMECAHAVAKLLAGASDARREP